MFSITTTSEPRPGIIQRIVEFPVAVAAYAIRHPWFFSLKLSAASGFILGIVITAERSAEISSFSVFCANFQSMGVYSAYLAFMGGLASLTTIFLLDKANIKSTTLQLFAGILASGIFTWVIGGMHWPLGGISSLPSDQGFAVTLLIRAFTVTILPGIVGGCAALLTVAVTRLVTASHTSVSLNKPAISISSGERKLLENM